MVNYPHAIANQFDIVNLPRTSWFVGLLAETVPFRFLVSPFIPKYWYVMGGEEGPINTAHPVWGWRVHCIVCNLA